jgi:hypothetical protein
LDLDEVLDKIEKIGVEGLTEEEKNLIDQVVWLSPDEAIRQFRHAESKVDAWVHRRDLRAFIYLLENQDQRG